MIIPTQEDKPMADDRQDAERDPDKVIKFPGSAGISGAEGGARPASAGAAEQVSAPGQGSLGIPNLTQDQEKAFQIAIDGMSFVMIGIKPTDSGADFFTAVHGQREELRNATDHLDGVIRRAFARYDI
jgi:hypothetical protein